MTGKTPFDSLSIQSAVSGVLYEYVSEQGAVFAAEFRAHKNFYRSLGPASDRQFLDAVGKVDAASLQRVLAQYFTPLFNPQLSNCAICCNSGKSDAVVAGFQGFGRTLSAFESIEQAVTTLGL